jgi:large subunit ribosomal protein L13
MISTQAWTPHWYVLDAEGKTLGRFAAEVAKILRGKHKTTFTPHSDNGDGVIIVNVDKIKVTGAKAVQKIYRYYTGHIGGLRETTYETMKEKKPEYILEHAVRGMMPKTKLGRRQRKRLRLFKGDKHTLAAQQPTTVDV